MYYYLFYLLNFKKSYNFRCFKYLFFSSNNYLKEKYNKYKFKKYKYFNNFKKIRFILLKNYLKNNFYIFFYLLKCFFFKFNNILIKNGKKLGCFSFFIKFLTFYLKCFYYHSFFFILIQFKILLVFL